jgi:UPF0755 protein
MRRAALFLLFVVVGIAAAAGGAWWWTGRPLALPAEPYSFDVRSGASLGSVARDLASAGVLPDARILIAYARLAGVDRAIKAGNYELPAGTTLRDLVARFTQGDVTQTALTIVEGSTFAELRAALKANPAVRDTVLGLDGAALMQKIGAEATAPEGWFFPDTYFFAAGSADVALLARAHRLMRARLDAAWAGRAPGLPLANPYEALILASIVEKETGRAADRPLIASVFTNRLKLGMRLQTDPTVIYGIGATFDGNLRRRDLDADTPYNTYTRAGLPPPPIALPSQASLDAVVNPPPSDYLYFVARGDGSSQFSTNLADHNRAVAKFQKGGR